MSIIRDITIKAQNYLDNDDILLFIGPRQAGKTTILRQLKSILEKENRTVCFFNLEDPDYLDLLNKSPKNLFKIFTMDLSIKNFILIDEIQYLKNPSNFLKYFFDEYSGKIKMLVSGSSAFYLDAKFKDSLAGRKRIFNVSTLSFREFLRFKNDNDMSVKDFGNLSMQEKEKVSLYFREYIIYGGYPRVVLAPLEEKQEIMQELAYSYIKKDIYDANIRHSEIFYKLFKILSQQIGSLINTSELSATLGVSKSSIDNYLFVMQKSFHIRLIRPFFKNIRKELTKMPKIYFSDLGLRNFFADNFKNLELREDSGPLLENAALRQLVEKYDESNIKFWRTIQKNEVDFVVGDKEAFEVKSRLKNFKKENYKIFIENYPDIKFHIISFDVLSEEVNKLTDNFKVMEIWQV